MKSNRMRLWQPIFGIEGRIHAEGLCQLEESPLEMDKIAPPLPITKVSPDQLIEDILVATLRRVQKSASPEVAAAAARYISLLSENAL